MTARFDRCVLLSSPSHPFSPSIGHYVSREDHEAALAEKSLMLRRKDKERRLLTEEWRAKEAAWDDERAAFTAQGRNSVQAGVRMPRLCHLPRLMNFGRFFFIN